MSIFMSSHQKYNTQKTQTLPLLTVLAGLVMLGFTSQTATANTLISKFDYLDYGLPAVLQERCYEHNNCPEIEVEYVKTNHDWINQIINARVNNIVINSQFSESAVNPDTSRQAAKAALDKFVAVQFMDTSDDRQWGYHLMVNPTYLGHVGQFEMFEINSYTFTGGAHGMPFSEFMMFDLQTKKQVQLADMLKENQKSRFEALAYQAFRAWVKTLDEDVDDYEKSWPFTLSDNVILTDKGIDIRYQHYEIAPYAYGMPVLSIPYSRLRGIIKPQFLTP